MEDNKQSISDDIMKMSEYLDKLETGPEVRNQTFMEVAGFPHYENVASNILSFLFTSDAEHGFGDLWVKALISCIVPENIKSTNNSIAEREVYTIKGNRIDLLITTDDYVICLENKIYASLYNDLKDYDKSTKKYINHLPDGNEKEQKNIILCLNKEVVEQSLKNNTTSEQFKVVTYNQLFEAVRYYWGECFYSCSDKWIIYVKDFMTTIDALSGGNMEKNDAYFEFYRKYNDKIEKMNEQCRQYFLQRANNVLRLLEEAKESLNYKEHGVYKPNNLLWRSVYIDYLTTYNQDITVETRIDFEKWHVSLMQRNGRQEKISNWLKSNNFKIINDGTVWDNTHHIIMQLELSTSDEDVAEHIKRLVLELRNKRLI